MGWMTGASLSGPRIRRNLSLAQKRRIRHVLVAILNRDGYENATSEEENVKRIFVSARTRPFLEVAMASTLSTRRRTRRYVSLVVLVALLFGGWSAFWLYASDRAQQAIEGWRAREAKAGRIYSCGTQTIGGFPFRIEFDCEHLSATFRGQLPLEIQGKRTLVAAQIYDPTLLIGEFSGPLTIADPGKTPSFIANWSLGQSSVRGTPRAPERVSLVFDGPVLEHVNARARQAILRAKHIEIHGRIAEGSVTDKPVIETVLRFEQASMPAFHPATVQPMNAEITAILRGLNDFMPKTWPARFREIQAAGGRIDIAQARIEQGEILAVGEGALSLNASGHLQGQLRVTVAGLDHFLAKIGAQRMVQNSPTVDKLAGALNRLVPGLGQVAREQAGANISAGINMLGEQTTLEGQPAVTMPLRFDDGAVFLGPIPIGKTPALF